MIEFRLPRNSRVEEGQSEGQSGQARPHILAGVSDLSLESQRRPLTPAQ